MGMMINRRRACGGGGNPFIQFADPAVKDICVANWGGADGGTAPLNTRVNNVKVTGVDGEMTYEQAASIITLPSRTFYNNSEIITLDDIKYLVNLRNVGSEVFKSLPNMESITLPPSEITYTAYAFHQLNKFNAIHITDIKAYMNSNMSGQDSSPTLIAKHLYLNGVEVTSATVPNDVTRLRGCFNGLSNFTSITLHNAITELGDWTFFSTGITELNIPDSVTRIGNNCLGDCRSLRTLNIGSGVTYYGQTWYMRALETITCKAMTAPTLGDAKFLDVKQGGVLYVPIGSTGYSDNWMTGQYSLGAAGWTMQEIDM